jgi:hypothetical protein
MHAFFACISSGEVATLDPPLGRKLDFYRKQLDVPIEITARFLMAEGEFRELKEAITTEAPQIRNAIADIRSPIELVVTLSIISDPPFAIVSRIALAGC